MASTARWYTREQIPALPEGVKLPSVTTITGVLDKPALMGWAVREEQKRWEAAVLAAWSEGLPKSADGMLRRLREISTAEKAHQRQSRAALDVGSQAHALIEWHTQRMLGKVVGPEPKAADGAQVAVMAWQDWCRKVDFKPLLSEHVVWCTDCTGCQYAGRLDTLAIVEGVSTLVDYKSARAVYAEHRLQLAAYAHALESCAQVKASAQMVVLLPKDIDGDLDPKAVAVEPVSLDVFQAARRLWAWANDKAA